MARINVLPKNIADLIAAGEVVERPSSVIKEFVENSIDAGATIITVEIKNGGKTYIRVTDNGCGIDREDVKNAFVSHATSKISTADDLESIATLGFRGEALASISAVSKVELLTATEGSESGTRYVIEGGAEVLIDHAGCPVGTTLVVRDLFFNIPARLKFLKKDVQEGNYIAAILEKIALSNPQISFRFIRDGKLSFKTPGDGDLKGAVYAVLGKEFTNGLLPVFNEQNGIKVTGFVTKPTACRSSRSLQTFFVNKRYVKSPMFMSALEAAYKNSVMVGKFPGCVLFVYMPYEAVDVNVHPAKTEVRFFEEKKIFDVIYYGVYSALNDDSSRVQIKFSEAKVFTKPKDEGEQLRFDSSHIVKPKVTAVEDVKTEPNTVFFKEQPSKNVSQLNFTMKSFGNPVTGSETTLRSPQKEEEKQLDFLEEEYLKPKITNITIEVDGEPKKSEISAVDTPIVSGISDENALEKVNVPDFKYLGEAFNTYLIAQTESKLLLIDKHAAHERLLFEKFKKDGGRNSQMMLQGITVTLSADEYSAISENFDLLLDAGYDISDFGDRTVKISACPPELTDCDLRDIVAEIAGYLVTNNKNIIPEKLDWIYHSMACRAAVKAGNFTSAYEAERFIRELLKREDIRYCPHGRPILVEMSRQELEKQFLR